MSGVALSPNQVRAYAARVFAELPDVAVVGIHSVAAWAGPGVLEVGGISADVVWSDSPLAIRARLAEPPDGGRKLVLITPLEEKQIGQDVLARLAKCRLKRLRGWEMVKELFQARAVDPRLAEQGWMADMLLTYAPPGGFAAVAAGVLDMQTVWRILLAHQIGLSADTASVPGEWLPDAQAILRWSLRGEHLDRYRSSPEEFRKALREWIVEPAGELGRILLDCVEAGQGRDLVPLGLACRVVFHESGDAAPVFREGAVRLERFVKDEPLVVGVARAWAAAAEEVVHNLRRAEGGEPARAILERADQILRDLRADEFIHLSPTSPAGFEKRLVRYAEALAIALTNEAGSDAPTALLDAEAAVVRHDEAAIQVERVARVRMSLRLVRWLGHRAWGGGSVDGLTSFAQAAGRYMDDGSWVDWARATLASEGAPRLAEVLGLLAERVTGRREEESRRFGELLADWVTAGTSDGVNLTPGSVLPIENVLSKVVAPLADQQPVLLIVMDGMSFPIFRELMDDPSLKRDWVVLRPGEGGRMPPVVAAIPSVTEVSRTSLLCGRLAQGSQPDEITGFRSHADLLAASRAGHAPVLFHKAGLEVAGQDLAPELREMIASTRQRVVGLVMNAIDDYLLKGDQIRPPWTVSYFKLLPALLHAARAAGRVVILASDHGHVVDRDMRYQPSDQGERWRAAAGGASDEEVLLQGQRVVLSGGKLIAPWGERLRFGGKKNGYHGGASPQEMIAPLAVLAPRGMEVEGWSEALVFPPSWWEAAVEEPEAVVVAAPPAPAKVVVSETLFEQPPQELPKPPEPPVPPGWIEELLRSPAMESQRGLAGRGAPSPEMVRAFLMVLVPRGGKVLRPALPKQLNLPPMRIQGLIAAMRRLLNVDGVDVLSVDEAADSVELNLERLRKQFELTK